MKTVRLLFNDAMARAIVEGRKTVTRRPVMSLGGYPVNPARSLGAVAVKTGVACFDMDGRTLEYARFPCAPGDLLIGRECWRFSRGGIAYRASEPDPSLFKSQWCSSTQMADAAARIRRRVVSVTVERLSRISEDDAIREGLSAAGNPASEAWKSAGDCFRDTWDAIYAAKGLGWADNPWVWRIEFSAENV